MRKSFLQALLGIALAASLASIVGACGGGGGGGGGGLYGGGGGMNPPPPSPSPGATNVIHLNLFGTSNGVFNDATFGRVTGFTQQRHAQVLGLPPGMQITITNNDSVPHTLNVYANAYPALGTPTTTAMPNGGIFGPGYQSGALSPGASTGVLTVTNTTGNLFIVCAFHYASNGMRDGAIVQVGATPGPQATPMPTGSGHPCVGYGCM